MDAVHIETYVEIRKLLAIRGAKATVIIATTEVQLVKKDVLYAVGSGESRGQTGPVDYDGKSQPAFWYPEEKVLMLAEAI